MNKIFLILSLVFSPLCLADSIPIAGTLHPNQVTKISAQVSGKLEQFFVKIGDTVEKGQVLAELDARTYALDLKKLEALAEMALVDYEESEVEFARMKNLWEGSGEGKHAIAKKQFDEALYRMRQKKCLLESVKADLEQAKIRLEETKIKAPYSGVITQKFADPGESIIASPSNPILEIMDLAHLVFEFYLPQELLKSVHCFQKVTVEGREEQIETVFPKVEEASRSFKCQVVLENKNGLLKPGQFAKGIIN